MICVICPTMESKKQALGNGPMLRPSHESSASGYSPVRPEACCLAASTFALHGAFMPAAQRQVGDEGKDQEDQDAARGDHEKRGEHAGDLQLVAGLEDAVGEPR